jgi:Na+-transporting NADH:ubiquinone oxidoreductase subunit NqrB
MVDRTPYRQQKTEQHYRVLVLLSLLLSIWCSVHHYFPLLSWSSCVSVAQSFVVYMVFCPPLFSSSFLVIVFWCCPVFCCLYGVLCTIISPFFPGHRVLVLLSLLLSIWCSVHHYVPLLSWTRKEEENNGGQNTI